METVLIILVIGTLNVACFFLGAKIGQKAAKGETISAPSLNPLKAVREHQDRKEAKRERDRYEAIMRNIENYDGTGANQEDVPRG